MSDWHPPSTWASREPLDWWLGWGATLSAGIVLSSCVACTRLLVGGVVQGVLAGDPGLVLVNLIQGVLLWMAVIFPVVLIIALIPISMSYVALRLAAPYMPMTVPHRLAIGALLGALTIGAFIWIADPHESRTWEVGALASRMARFPYLETEASAIVPALVARPQWFGIAPQDGA